MRAMLDHHHADRGQLGELMAAEPARGPALRERERTTASPTGVGIVIDDLINLVLRREPPTRAAMSRLPARLALAARELLRLRSGLSPALLTRLGRITRRRLRARARVLAHLLLQSPQPLRVLLNPTRQLEHELHTDLTPRVIDRHRLRAVHDCKIRCTNKESLPPAPTTERLRLFGVPLSRSWPSARTARPVRAPTRRGQRRLS
jgi:hypothetical protein